MDIIDNALKKGQTALSEYESKQILASYGIPVTAEKLITNGDELREAAGKIGYPLVVKGCSANMAHKTEKGLIRVDIRNETEALSAFDEITEAMAGEDGAILVQEMVRGSRELVVGLTRDSQFGPCVMFGLGGIFTEVLKDTSFRVAPLGKRDAMEMMQEIRAHKILDPVRGMPAANKDMLADMLVTVGRIGLENEMIREIDINPVIISGAKPVAVDALVVLEKK
jgi:acetyl-CoA synthetase (ADP-forming)